MTNQPDLEWSVTRMVIYMTEVSFNYKIEIDENYWIYWYNIFSKEMLQKY